MVLISDSLRLSGWTCVAWLALLFAADLPISRGFPGNLQTTAQMRTRVSEAVPDPAGSGPTAVWTPDDTGAAAGTAASCRLWMHSRRT